MLSLHGVIFMAKTIIAGIDRKLGSSEITIVFPY